MNRDFWKQRGEDKIKTGTYVRLIALFTLISVGIVAVGATVSYSWPFTWYLWVGSFIAMLVGTIIFATSDDPARSVFGVVMMSAAAGIMMGPYLATKSLEIVLQAILITGGIVGVMSIVGIIFPKVFEGFGPYLLAGLVVLLIAMLGQMIFAALGFSVSVSMPILYWVGIILFTLYVAYDWSRALKIPHTINNAIIAAGSLTLDIINIFLRVFGLGRSKS
jgi:FtsH-binding integral membrane protein